MARRVALLRGINLAGRRRVAMADLRALVEGLGYEDVATHLQSGNVVLGASEPPARTERRIAAALQERLGFPVDVVVRVARDLDRIVADNPFPDEAERDPARLQVVFLDRAPDDAAARSLEGAETGPDRLRVRGREVYAWCPEGVGRSAGMAAIGSALDGTATARNWNTVLRLREMARGG